ncbi:unnamed protein product [Clonostachys rosea]|uniref:Uncharacterized protein n=1 Tax=Bionectria ochroleuca TaxID=29856 RepID=A0ABY6U621_BIOOC|nr:unnamed protein product [Clonostachys rosea]
MAEERPPYHDNDLGPFASICSMLRLTMIPTPLAFFFSQNVREDTVAEAEAAVNSFLDQLEPLNDEEYIQDTVFMVFDKVHTQMSRPLASAT